MLISEMEPNVEYDIKEIIGYKPTKSIQSGMFQTDNAAITKVKVDENGHAYVYWDFWCYGWYDLMTIPSDARDLAEPIIHKVEAVWKKSHSEKKETKIPTIENFMVEESTYSNCGYLAIDKCRELVKHSINMSDADMYWYTDEDGSDPRLISKDVLGTELETHPNQCIPTYTAEDILENIPNIIDGDVKRMYIPLVYRNGNNWVCDYHKSDDFSKTYKYNESSVLRSSESLIDVVYDMLMWRKMVYSALVDMFKDAKFGSEFRTREGKRAIYHNYDDERGYHTLIIEGGEDVRCYSDGKNICNDYPTRNDIVGKCDCEKISSLNFCHREFSDEERRQMGVHFICHHMRENVTEFYCQHTCRNRMDNGQCVYDNETIC